jgi:lysophospholipase L1-like esterase
MTTLHEPGPDRVARRRKSTRRRWIFRLLLVGFLLLLVGVAAEILLRLLWSPPEAFRVFNTAPSWRSPEPGCFEPLPGFVGGFQEAYPQDLPPSARFEPRVLEIRINSQGLRGPEYGPKKAGQTRILFGGDSLTFGHAVDESESYPAVAGQVLTKEGLSVEVCNAGVPGYGFAATCKRLRRLRDTTEADVLVATYFLGNDFTDDIAQRSCTVVAGCMFGGPFGNLLQSSWRARLCLRSRLALFCEIWLIEHAVDWSILPGFRFTAEQQELHDAMPEAQTAACLFLDAPREYRFRPGVEPVVALWLRDIEVSLRQLQRDAEGRQVLVVVLPSQFHVDTDLRASVLAEMHADAAVLQLGNAQRHLVELCERVGLPCLDTTPVVAAAGRPEAIFQQDHIHMSIAGNQVVGKVVAEKLATMLR